MTRDEVLTKIKDARRAIEEFKRDRMDLATSTADMEKVQQIRKASIEFISEANTIGAAGNACPRCGGSGRA